MSDHVVLPSLSDVVKFRGQDFERIQNICVQEGILWEDHNFIPDIGDLELKRPWEISPSPLLLSQDETQDVRRGSLDDGYLVAAMQALTGRPELLHWVVPPNQQCSRDNGGIVHFRIWQLGTWYDVCVDDRLPTEGGKLAYIHSHDVHQFWCALLEKAYAKLHGSYQVLEAGQSADAMVDLTGGLSECIRLDHPPLEFGGMLLEAYEKNLLMCCAQHQEQHDFNVINVVEMFKGSRRKEKDDHHYTITKVQLHPTSNLVLVRLKDSNELNACKGSWGDPDSEKRSLIDSSFKTLGLEVNNDREFWISEQEFTENFTTLSICHQSPDTFLNTEDVFRPLGNWWMNSFKGEWVRGVSAGGKHIGSAHLNNQYRITLVETDDNNIGQKGLCCFVVISLLQKNKTRRVEWNLGFKVFHLERAEHLPSPLGQEFFASNPYNFGFRSQDKRREVVKRLHLLPGTYCIIPCTNEKNEEGEFLLRVFTGKKSTMEKSDKRVSVVDVEPNIAMELVRGRMLPLTEEGKTEHEVIQLFCETAGKDLTLDWEGLKTILDKELVKTHQYSLVKIFNAAFEKVGSAIHFFFPFLRHSDSEHTGHVRFSKHVCRTLISLMDESDSGKIGIDEFDRLWNLLCEWRFSFRLHSNKKKGVIEPENLGKALEKVGVCLSMDVLGSVIHRYGDEQGHISFDDFIMCIAALQLDMTNFQDTDKENAGKVEVSLNEWIKKSVSA